ncbi:MAG: SseB family protein [Erysipelotrichaceae bacterium]|jgi:hypothetical protein|nr:SseB family protein [Erysipelotrichaceae bacterium]
MKKYLSEKDLKKDNNLEKLLEERKAPLSEEGMRLALTDLTMYLTGPVSFITSVYPKKELKDDPDLHAKDVFKADVMQGTDKENYFPVFTSLENMNTWKKSLSEGEYYYVMDKRDLLDFLHYNAKIAAVVVNPGIDDLLLYRMQLQNLIHIGSENQ